ncbi:MAG TPA: glycosyltransferase family 2 protein [Casimicrobiaceae bacterium]|nr:glycosyltransferase family 2 protein [Casimicrobiaceae bacterium]
MSWLLPHPDADVSVVIVSYKTREVTRRTLESLRQARQQVRVEVVVVDNASDDGTAEMVRSQFPETVLVASERNLGHSGGCNLGMRHARGRHLLCLNSDTQMLAGTLDRLAAYLDAHPAVGAVAPKVLNPDGTIQGTIKRFPTPSAALFGRYSPLTRLFPRNPWSRRYLAYLECDFSRPFRCDTASACALMVRREAIERAGAFDERFFLYWNDVDWCRAIASAGFEIHCVPDAAIVHDQHKGGTRAGLRRLVASTIDFHKGAYRYYRKWHLGSAWHPLSLAAAMLLSLRAAAVIAAETAAWLLGVAMRETSGRKESAG